MKDKLKILKVLKLISPESSIGICRLDILVRTKFAEIDAKSLDLGAHLPELLDSMLKEELIIKTEYYKITEKGLKYLEDNI